MSVTSTATNSRATNSVPPTIVMYEDRPDALIGLKLGILSLARHSPQLRVLVTVPSAPQELVDWIADQPNADMVQLDLQQTGWDVKPALLTAHLRAGNSPVVWLDADIIANGDLAALLAAPDPDSLILTEDVWWGQEVRSATYMRTDAWGLPRGQLLPFLANTSVVRVTTAHLALLAAWKQLLEWEPYRAAQLQPWELRPISLAGDQDALTALLSSRDWSGTPVAVLHRGSDIAHCASPGGFSPAERLTLWRRRQVPTLVHAASKKPWQTIDFGGSFLGRSAAEAHDVLSPYTMAARAYARDLPGEMNWADCELSDRSWLMRRLSRSESLLAELPWTVYDATRLQFYRVRQWLMRGRTGQQTS